MTIHYGFLIALALVAFAALLVSDRRHRIALAILAAVIAIAGIAHGKYQADAAERERQRQIDLSLKQEVSASQYITLGALARNDPTSRRSILSAFADGRVIWAEYTDIEREVALRLFATARDDARAEIQNAVANPENDTE